MRIVLVFPDPPLPFGNAAARWYHVLLRGLVGRGHRVTAFVVNPDPATDARIVELYPDRAYDIRIYHHPRRGGPLARLDSFRRPYAYQFSPELRRDLAAELAGGFDVLQAELTWTGWAVLGVCPLDQVVLDVHSLYAIDLARAPAGSLVDRLRRRRVFAAERALIRRFPNVTTLTPRLTREVQQISPNSTAETVPLALDLSLYPFEPASEAARPPVVGLIGSFHWEPTRSAGVRLLTRLWPEIRRRVPGARLQVVGRRARSALGSLANGPGIAVAEDVPEILPYFRQTDVLLYAPGPATGMKVKVLEAFALGAAVVTNADGVEGLPAIDDVHAGICESDAGLIERTVALLADPGRRQRQCLAARALVEIHCAQAPVLDRVEALYLALRSRLRAEGR